MNYKLNVTDGNVKFLLKCGKDFVSSQMSEASTQRLIDIGPVEVVNDRNDYRLCVNNNWFFDCEVVGTKNYKENR